MNIQNVFQTLQKKLAPTIGQLSSQKHFAAIRNGVMFTIPFTIIGGLMMIIAQPPFDPQTMQATNFFLKFLLMWKTWATAHFLTLMTPYYLTMGIIALIAVAGIAYSLADSYKMNKLSAVAIAMVTFLMVAAPFSPGKEAPNVLFMPTTYLDSKGLFAAMIIAIVTVEITRMLEKRNIRIIMPASVPPMVAAPFEALIPAVINVGVFFLINLLGMQLFGVSLPQLVMNMFQPLVSATESLTGVLLIYLLLNFLWLLGIHGGAVVLPLIMPFMMSNLLENAQAYTAGQALPHIFTFAFHFAFANIGGSGAALGLGIAIFIAAKSAQLKSIGKVGIVPLMFNISEPFVFGTPVIMNPVIALPFILVPTINIILSYLVFGMGLMKMTYLMVPTTAPGPIIAFLSTMDWKALVFWFVLAVIDVLIYLPFVKTYDTTLLKKEMETAASA